MISTCNYACDETFLLARKNPKKNLCFYLFVLNKNLSLSSCFMPLKECQHVHKNDYIAM